MTHFFIDAFRIFLPDAGLVFGAIAVMGALSNNDNNRFYFQIKNTSVVNHIRLYAIWINDGNYTLTLCSCQGMVQSC